MKTQDSVDTGELEAVLTAVGCMRRLDKQTGLRLGRNSYSRGRTSDVILLVMGIAKNKAATGNQRIGMSEKEEGNLWWETKD